LATPQLTAQKPFKPLLSLRFKQSLSQQNLSADAAAILARQIRAFSMATAVILLVLPLPCRTRQTRKLRSRSSVQERISPATPDVRQRPDTTCKPLPADRFSARSGFPPEDPTPSEGRALSSKSYFVSILDE